MSARLCHSFIYNRNANTVRTFDVSYDWFKSRKVTLRQGAQPGRVSSLVSTRVSHIDDRLQTCNLISLKLLN